MMPQDNKSQDWETPLAKVFSKIAYSHSSGITTNLIPPQELVSFISSLLTKERESIREKVEGMRKNEIAWKLATLEHKENYDQIYFGYNQAIEDILELLK